jgi:hypothetical protein
VRTKICTLVPVQQQCQPAWARTYTFDDDFGGAYTFDDSESQPTLLMTVPTAMYQQHENTKDQ